MIKNICCIGAGYVGGPTMSVIADRCPDITVNVVDLNQKRIEAWNSNDLSKLPVFEPSLDMVVGRTRGKNLFFTNKIIESIENADMIFISVNTPTKNRGIGFGEASDLSWVESCARDVAKYSSGHTIVVEKSTLPVKTAETIKSILYSVSSSLDDRKKTFAVLSNPEFLAEGTAINDLENPDRVLIGGEDEEAIEELANIYKYWVKDEKIIRTNLWSSELSKLAANAFLAQRISSINSLSAFCEESGANIEEVAKAVGLDNRIGKKFLKSGPGFGGSCFKKDILNLVYLSKTLGLEEVSNYWRSVIELNDWQQNRIYKIIVAKLFGSILNKQIGILGFAFKANTNDSRESPAIDICRNLLLEGSKLIIHDPKVSSFEMKKSLSIFDAKEKPFHNIKNSDIENWEYADSISKVFTNSHAVVILTEWEDYQKIDWEKYIEKMEKPAWVFDTRNILNINNSIFKRINLWQLGNGTINQKKDFF